MTIKGFVVRWDKLWHYDLWWRQKHRIAFNSSEHREISQIDVVFEYVEDYLLNQAIDRHKEDERKNERFKKDGWISESEENKERIIDAYNKIDFSKL